jgi:hypothetical protein
VVLGWRAIQLPAQQFLDPAQDGTERLTRYLPRQIEAVPAATLTADEPAQIVLVVPPKSVGPAADRAGAMPIDQKAAIDPKGREQCRPMAFG